MHKIINSKFIKSKGYWFNIVQTNIHEFKIFNTKRKRNQIDRDGLGFYISEISFKNIKKAKEYLDNLC